MQLFLKIPECKTLLFSTSAEFYSSAVIQEMQEFIEMKTGIPSESYTLHSKLKQNEKITNLSQVRLSLRLLGGFNLYVKNLKGERHCIDADGYENIASIKLKVMAKFNVPPQFQRIVFAGKQLEDERTIYDYNISKESTLFLVLRVYDNKLD